MRFIFYTLLLCLALLVQPTYAQSTIVHGPTGSTTITTGGTAQIRFGAGDVFRGCYIYNPQSSTGQGISASESLYVDFTGTTPTVGGSTTQEILPGVAFPCPQPNGNTVIKVYAATTGHKFIAYAW